MVDVCHEVLEAAELLSERVELAWEKTGFVTEEVDEGERM